MIAIGEKTGELESMLNNISDAYDTQVDNAMSGLTSLLEPIMIVLLGVIVAFIVVSIMLPILDMNSFTS